MTPESFEMIKEHLENKKAFSARHLWNSELLSKNSNFPSLDKNTMWPAWLKLLSNLNVGTVSKFYLWLHVHRCHER